jgi:hypothetical protein
MNPAKNSSCDPPTDGPYASNIDYSPLPQEEYVEQAHFFDILVRRLRENLPAQEVLSSIREEVLATTKLPMAIDFLQTELRHQGGLTEGMRRLGHYFTPFQCYVMSEAENDRRRFDMRLGLEILSREAGYRSEGISRQGLFLYQFEAISRNRLGYDAGLEAISQDPSFDATWQQWILTVRRQIGIVELADLIYVRSLFHNQQRMAQLGTPIDQAAATRAPTDPAAGPPTTINPSSPTALFGLREGRIAWANRHKDPLLLFSALHRHLGYPIVPRPKPPDPHHHLLPALARRIEQLEMRLKMVEEEQRGGIDLRRFYTPPDPT